MATQRYKQKVIEEFTEKTREGRETLQDIAKSRAFIYPIQGIYYSVRNPSLFVTIKSQIYKSIILSLVVTVLFFVLFYIPQVVILAFTTGPLAFIGAIPVVIGEAAVISRFLAKGLWLSDAQEKLFDEVLSRHTASAPLVENWKVLTRTSTGRSSKIGKLMFKPVSRFSPAEVIRYVISLPLNAIPGLGTAFFLLYNGTKTGPHFHVRYFALTGQSDAQREDIVAKRRGAYASFGTMATALQLIPGLSMFFEMSSIVGAALWAAELERLEKRVTESNREL